MKLVTVNRKYYSTVYTYTTNSMAIFSASVKHFFVSVPSYYAHSHFRSLTFIRILHAPGHMLHLCIVYTTIIPSFFYCFHCPYMCVYENHDFKRIEMFAQRSL